MDRFQRQTFREEDNREIRGEVSLADLFVCVGMVDTGCGYDLLGIVCESSAIVIACILLDT